MERARPNNPARLSGQISIDPIERRLHGMVDPTHYMRWFLTAPHFDRLQYADKCMPTCNWLWDELVDRVTQTALAPVIAQALEMFSDLFGSNFSILKGKITKAQD